MEQPLPPGGPMSDFAGLGIGGPAVTEPNHFMNQPNDLLSQRSSPDPNMLMTHGGETSQSRFWHLFILFVVLLSIFRLIWRPLTLSELTPYCISKELTHLGSEVSILYRFLYTSCFIFFKHFFCFIF